jgi:predicted aconitase
MISLEPIDRALLDGTYGEAAARAMAMLVRYGEAVEAERFVGITAAHIDACMYHGQSGIEFARYFVELGGRVRVPTTMNAASVDVTHPEWHCGPNELIDQQALLSDLYIELGCIPTMSCAPYQRLLRPRIGEHVAWAESNAIVFANSVIGAKTDRYGDFADLCAALSGRVPFAGLHRDQARRPALVVRLPSATRAGLPRDLYFGAAGYVVGSLSQGDVPYVNGLPADSSEDELKAFGAAGASSGALALFHAEGITPEAELWAIDGLPVHSSSAGALRAAITRLSDAVEGEPVAAVCLGTPHYSVHEFQLLNAELSRRGGKAAAPVIVTTSREIEAQVEADRAFEPLRRFGVQILVDTCSYIAPVVRAEHGVILTTSVKFAHYGPGNLSRRVKLATLERCVRSAMLGRVSN